MLILGSTSPRRKEILGFFSLPFEVIGSDFDEESVVFEGDPVEYVLGIAKGKAQNISLSETDVLLTADTTVHFDGKVLNKPQNEEEAWEMLCSLNGSTHEVYTGLCGVRGKEMLTDYECTKVQFVKASEEDLRKYHKAIYSADKAGGYAIQKAGSLIVEKIEGCYYNVMGLPVIATGRLLNKLGINLWDYLAN